MGAFHSVIYIASALTTSKNAGSPSAAAKITPKLVLLPRDRPFMLWNWHVATILLCHSKAARSMAGWTRSPSLCLASLAALEALSFAALGAAVALQETLGIGRPGMTAHTAAAVNARASVHIGGEKLDVGRDGCGPCGKRVGRHTRRACTFGTSHTSQQVVWHGVPLMPAYAASAGNLRASVHILPEQLDVGRNLG